MAISSKEIEFLWKRYSEEVNKRGVSVARYFEANGVPYKAFERWYKNEFSQLAVVDCVVKENPDVSPDPSHEQKDDATGTRGINSAVCTIV